MNIRKVVFISVAGALSGALSVIENMISINVLPGGKIGLANIVLIIVLELFGSKETYAVCMMKSILALFATGSITGFLYSVCGGFSAVFFMSRYKKVKNVSVVGVGISGAFANNLTQTAIAAAVMKNSYIFYYIGMMGPVSIVMGIFTGLTAKMCVKYLIKKDISYV